MIRVIDATVTTQRGGFTNMASVEFKIEGEEKTFHMNFYNQELQGVVYLFSELKARGIKEPHDTEQLSKDILAVLEAKGESLDVTFEVMLQHREEWFKGITVSKEEKYAILGRIVNSLENNEQKEEFKK